MERLGLGFPVSEFEPLVPDYTTFVGNWEFQRHGISRGLGLQFRNSRISIPSPRLHCHLTYHCSSRSVATHCQGSEHRGAAPAAESVGATAAARFLEALVQTLEAPLRLLL